MHVSSDPSQPPSRDSPLEPLHYRGVSLFQLRNRPIDAPKQLDLIINPESYCLLLWDMLLLLLLIIQGLYLPFIVCFSYPLTGSMLYLDYCITVCFLFDILLNFNIGYNSKGVIIKGRGKIARHYLKNWFIIDLLVSFPFDWLLHGDELFSEADSAHETKLDDGSQLLKLFRVTKLVRILRLVRFAKLKKMLLSIEENIESEVITSSVMIIRLCSVVMFLAH